MFPRRKCKWINWTRSCRMSKHWFTCMARNKSLSWLLSNALLVRAGYGEDRQFVKCYVRLSLCLRSKFFAIRGFAERANTPTCTERSSSKICLSSYLRKLFTYPPYDALQKKAVSLVWWRPTRCLQGHSRQFVKCYFCPPFLFIPNPLLLLLQTNKYVLRCKWCDIQINPKHCFVF